ncbi:MAG: transposase, partial [Planctomycetaceae bacterium]|nr:transposase [Planctomycetaceae bacterium]
MQQVAHSLQLFEQITACLHDPRLPEQIIHSQRDLLAQRILAIACGYEDVNDHFFFRQDAAVLA